MTDLDISMIVAHDRNFYIGDTTDQCQNHGLPWLSRMAQGDMQRFKNLTMNSTCIVGSGTKLPKLPGRTVMRLSKTKRGRDYCTVEEALNEARTLFQPVFVIGGKQVYEYFLERDLIQTVYVSFINTASAFRDVALKPDFLKNFDLVKEEPLLLGDEASGNLFRIYQKKKMLLSEDVFERWDAATLLRYAEQQQLGWSRDNVELLLTDSPNPPAGFISIGGEIDLRDVYWHKEDLLADVQIVREDQQDNDVAVWPTLALHQDDMCAFLEALLQEARKNKEDKDAVNRAA